MPKAISSQTMPDTPRSWVLIGSETAIQPLAPLIEAHQVSQPVRLIQIDPNEAISIDRLQALALPDTASILWIGPPHQSPRTAVPGLFLTAHDGRKIPIGWLPNLPDRLAIYAQAAATVVSRSQATQSTRSLAFLGPRDDRSQDLIKQLEATFKPLPYATFQWTADRIRQPDVQQALSCGLGAALYVGHGFPNGWAGYGGVTFDRFADVPHWKAIGALLCLTCHNASRHRVSLSFAEEWVLSGRCGVAIAATGATRHTLNRVFAERLCQAIQADVPDTIAPTLAHYLSHPSLQRLPLARYRIIGDPAMPLLGAEGSIEAATAVFAPAPDAVLPSLPLGLWG